MAQISIAETTLTLLYVALTAQGLFIYIPTALKYTALNIVGKIIHSNNLVLDNLSL